MREATGPWVPPWQPRATTLHSAAPPPRAAGGARGRVEPGAIAQLEKGSPGATAPRAAFCPGLSSALSWRKYRRRVRVCVCVFPGHASCVQSAIAQAWTGTAAASVADNVGIAPHRRQA
ncbi:uncharacterized protein FIBRA_08763 [Fibroporia radiculosa]|uniref:Uncharacterized protein n=1 Tax=Fibroporia radiculosa TaxID=599839 RepID=J4H5C4_9APHY|nr:uncharacterized protein FIBRA_08763 [Fibroporia radiculosa]CCM06494.1 predicted protein [Fibroporia radiculosa]